MHNVKKYSAILVLLLVFSVLMFSAGKVAHAQISGFESQNSQGIDFASDPIACTSVATCIVYFASYLITAIAGVFVSFASWLVMLGLTFNFHVYDSPAVTTGFSVALSIANLGFVLGLIIIALATILHRTTYGIKQLLWRLVFMAILVNFGLVITRPVVNFSDTITYYFLNRPELGGGGIQGFASKLQTAFAPQNLQNPAAIDSGGAAAPQQNKPPADSFVQQVLSMLFKTFFSFVIVITLFTLAALLLVRYIALGILLIVLPFAWLLWIFPGSKGQFSKWLHEFINWTFFPPAALFFVFLALLTAGPNAANPSSSPYLTNVTNQAGTGGPADAIKQSLGTANTAGANGGQSLMGQLADEVLLCGLTIGGLFAAGKMTGKAGGVVVNGGKAVSGAVGRYAGMQGKKAARWGYQRAGGQRINERLQRFHGFPGISALGRGMAGITAKGGKDLVKQAATNLGLSDMSKEQFIMAAQGARGNQNTLAILSHAQSKGWIDDLKAVGGEKDINAWRASHARAFGDYDQGGLKNDLDKTIGPVELIEAAKLKAAASGPMPKLTDESGLLGTEGAEVEPSALKNEAQDAAATAKEAMREYEKRVHEGKGVIIPGMTPEEVKVEHRGKTYEAGELLAAAEAATRASDKAVEDREARGNAARFVDREGALDKNKKGQEYAVGEFLEKMSEKFYAGKDKKDMAKFLASAIFGKEPKLGLSAEELDAFSRAVAHGVALGAPSLAGTIAGKLDNAEKLKNYIGKHMDSIIKAEKSGRLNDREAKERMGAIKQIKKSVMYGYGIGRAPGDEGTPAPTPASPK